MEDQRKYVISYDIESFCDYFCIGTSEYYRPNPDAKYRKVKGGTFIWTLDNVDAFIEYCKTTEDALWVGFNNASYDDLMIIRYKMQNILKETTNENMRALSDLIINKNAIITNQHISPTDMFYVVGGKLRISNKNRKDNWQPKVADLMLMTGEGSLKMKAIILNADSIMESPISFNDNVGDRKDDVHKYLLTDLRQTFLLYEHCENEFKVRDQFYEEFPEIAYGVNSPKLADEYFKHHTKSLDSMKKSYYGKSIKALDLLANDNISFANQKLSEFFEIFSKGKLIIPAEFESGVSTRFDFDKEIKHEDGTTDIASIIDLDIEQHQFQFGTGGLHSINKNGFWRCSDDEIIYNVDVKSYYPSMIEHYGINPSHVPDYSKQMAKILADRFKIQRKYKETGEVKYKVEEQAKKLLMNSSFGKLKDKFSYLFDQKALYTVTVTGQILLLKIIDMIIESGIEYELINANTDGIFLKTKKSNIEKLLEISRAWEKLTGVMLDAEYFTAWYQYSVNEYYAVQDSGKIKSKGTRCIYNPDVSKKLPVSKIVKVATFEYLHKGIDPMETLKSCTNISDFLVSANSTDFEQNGVELGYKALRVVYSESGSPITALKNDNVNGGYKRSIVLDNEPLKFIITLSENPVESADLNYDRYCWEVWKNIYTILKPRNDNDDVYFMPAKQPEYHWTHIKTAVDKLMGGIVGQWYDYLTDLGMSVIPKNICKVNYKGVRTKMKETWDAVDPHKCLGLGVVMDNHCSIDIDKPEMLDSDLKALLEKYPTMKVWHGKDNVLKGGKGAFIFKGSPKLKSNSAIATTHGFEWFNDEGKVQMVFGVHPKNELYKIKGEPIELPQEIEDYLMNLKVDGKRAISRITGVTKIRKIVSDYEIDVETIEKILYGGGVTLSKYKLADSKQSIECWDIGKHWFVVKIDQFGKYHVSSNHSNFLQEIEPLFK